MLEVCQRYNFCRKHLVKKNTVFIPAVTMQEQEYTAKLQVIRSQSIPPQTHTIKPHKKGCFFELLLHFSNVAYSSYTSQKAKSIPVAISARNNNTSSVIILTNSWTILCIDMLVLMFTVLQEPLRVGDNETSFDRLQGNSFANIQYPLTTGEVGSTLSCK